MSLKVMSSLFGEVEYMEDEVYHFENGIPGFEKEKSFLLLKVEGSAFTILHSTSADLYFFLMDPFTLFSDYKFTIPDYVLESLKITEREQVTCYVIAVLREPLSNSTVNLVAPVILNSVNHLGVQLVLENTSYSVRHPLGLYSNQTSSKEKNVKDNETMGKAATE
ncbi:flagellar assembly protein FliW [Aneurinibacillus sp. Ricciae_BoGa-3]|uniref:flagellar assembly protein FliW n=1 Tax=Aneurinibacillus sp. Ricciae_BoGa-3 TaxID=3022697 RepID=UPI002341F41F|nr:flagellar assembly protein FliW [Aneurinibacillus sp. Ricciae_BoGa-3]WCK54197.1 flagellar assembly protein FliW [Aneurinibacillus sp. Ricciae_BoGa-3]